MMWLTWRQHRLEAVGGAAVLAICSVILVGSGLHLHTLYDGGVATCLGITSPDATCAQLIQSFESEVNRGMSWLPWLNFIPGLIGVFAGAPLLAREVEQGTHRFAWTQSITRGRWLLLKLGLLVPAVALFCALFTALATWWLIPVGHIRSPLSDALFDLQGLMPAVYGLFSFALGVAAGAVLRRTVLAMAVTLGGFLAVRLPILTYVRMHYLAPLTVTTPLKGVAADGGVSLSPGAPPGAWVIDTQLVDSSGNSVAASLAQICPPTAEKDILGLNRCLGDHGVLARVVYQPADRYWPFQLIEAGIYLTLTVALVALAVWWVRRRLV